MKCSFVPIKLSVNVTQIFYFIDFSSLNGQLLHYKMANFNNFSQKWICKMLHLSQLTHFAFWFIYPVI